MEFPHTPDEWMIESGDSGDASVGLAATPPFVFSRVTVEDKEYDVPICTLDAPSVQTTEPTDTYDDGFRDFGTLEGNGYLIAAAPAMLNNLKVALAESVGRPSGRLSRDTLDAIRDTIAKAEGASA